MKLPRLARGRGRERGARHSGLKLETRNGQRFLKDTRILSEQEIRKMSDGSLKLYRKRVRNLRGEAHRMGKVFCCELCNEIISSEKLAADDLECLQTADDLWSLVNQEWANRGL